MRANTTVFLLSLFFLSLSACGPDAGPMQAKKDTNQREGTSLSSSDSTACESYGILETAGCGSEDHGAMDDDDAAPSGASNGNSSVETSGNTQGTSNSTGTNQAVSDTVEFHIAAGTGTGPWNTMAQMLTLKVGKTLVIINDDTIPHRLHTPGSPCDHQPGDMAPGGKYVCKIGKTFDPGTNAPLYDHKNGQQAAPFWIKAVR